MTKHTTAAPGRAVGYVRVSTDKQAGAGVSLEAQTARIRAMATVQDAELLDVIVDAGESAKSLNRPGMARLLEMIDARQVQTDSGTACAHRDSRRTPPVSDRFVAVLGLAADRATVAQSADPAYGAATATDRRARPRGAGRAAPAAQATGPTPAAGARRATPGGVRSLPRAQGQTVRCRLWVRGR